MKKFISTDQTPANIQEILRLLGETPVRLEQLCAGLADAQLHEPIAPGERSFHQVLTHLIHCESRSFEIIALALSKTEPVFTPLHPERDFGKQRKESVYWQARGLALHEWEHVQDLENKVSRVSRV
jgi:hypothetical protein